MDTADETPEHGDDGGNAAAGDVAAGGGRHAAHEDVHIRGLHWRPGTVPAWLRETAAESHWPVVVCVLVAVGLQLALPDTLRLGPAWLLPVLALLVLLALTAANPVRLNREHPALRVLSLCLVAIMAVSNGASIVLLLHRIIRGSSTSAVQLLSSGFAIWITNVIVFALWYWEFDRGGPSARRVGRRAYADFLFPQMSTPGIGDEHWEPQFVDYLYVSFTNSTAFSPTDTMPMTRWAKLLMLVQSAVSLVTVALIAARAVNILPGGPPGS